MRRRFKWDRKYLYWGITAFCVIGASLLLNYAVGNLPMIRRGISKVLGILAPFIWGVAIAYLLTPLLRVLEEKVLLPLTSRMYRKNKKNDGRKLARMLAVLLCEIVLLLVLVALVYMILPQVLGSVQTLVANSNTYADNLSNWIEKLLANYPQLEDYVSNWFDNFNANVGTWLENTILPRLGNVVTSVTSGVYGVAKGVYNLIIGIIVSIYLLGDKEGFLAAIKRLSYTIFSVERAERLRSGIKFVDRTFMGFLNGKLLDSLIIGIICYIVCAILHMPYTLLISLIIGVTNIIPFFGPLIGAIPSALIILMVDPVQCLVFVIFIIILQQIDGNIIGPRILGNSTGITGFWVMFSIILGGGLFGFWGMFLGVPVFVVIYNLLTNLIEKKLRRSDLPVDLETYKQIDYIDPATLQVVKKASVRKAEIAKEKALEATKKAMEATKKALEPDGKATELKAKAPETKETEPGTEENSAE